jgi:hypothetical protein
LSASLYDSNDLKKLEFATHLQARKPEKSQFDSKQECMEGKVKTASEEKKKQGACIMVSWLISLRSLIFAVHLEWRYSASNSLFV